MALNDDDILRQEREVIVKESNITTVFLVSHVLKKKKNDKFILFGDNQLKYKEKLTVYEEGSLCLPARVIAL